LPTLEVDPPGASTEAWLRLMERFDPSEHANNELRDVVAIHTRNLRGLRDELLRLQTRLRVIDTRIASLKAAPPKSAQQANIDAIINAIDEFLILLSLSDVKSLTIGDDREFHLFIEARVEDEGKLYDFGDWEVIFGGPRREEPSCICHRSGALPAFQTHMEELIGSGYIYTPYYYPDRMYGSWPENHFCLNRRKRVVVAALRDGRWLEALTTTYEALRSLEGYEMADNKRTIPSTFVCLDDVSDESTINETPT
jgi:hypothetical protein